MKSTATPGMVTLFDVGGNPVLGTVDAAGASPNDAIANFRNEYAGTNVTTGADLVVIASVVRRITTLSIFDSSGETMELKVNGVQKLLIFPGGNDEVRAFIAEIGDAITLRAVSNNAVVGEIDINFFG